MTLRRWNGWEPKRTTRVTKWQHGKPAEWVTEVEPEFDANERDNWYALAEYEAALCPQCGQLRSICEDPASAFNPQIHVCYASSAQSAYTRTWLKRYEDTKPDKDGWLPTDGALIWVSDELPPDEGFMPSEVNLNGDPEALP